MSKLQSNGNVLLGLGNFYILYCRRSYSKSFRAIAITLIGKKICSSQLLWAFHIVLFHITSRENFLGPMTMPNGLSPVCCILSCIFKQLDDQHLKSYWEQLHKGLRYKGWDVISEVHQLVVFPPTYFRRETGLVAYPRLKYLTPPLSVKIHLIFIIFQQFAYLKKLIKSHLGFAYHDYRLMTT